MFACAKLKGDEVVRLTDFLWGMGGGFLEEATKQKYPLKIVL